MKEIPGYLPVLIPAQCSVISHKRDLLCLLRSECFLNVPTYSASTA